MPDIESTRRGVCRLNIDTDPKCFVFDKPFRQPPKQFRGCSTPAALGNHVDPLQLAIAAESLREVSGDQSHERFPVRRDVAHSRRQRMLRMQLAVQVGRNSSIPVLFASPRLRADARHRRDIRLLRLSDDQARNQSTSCVRAIFTPSNTSHVHLSSPVFAAILSYICPFSIFIFPFSSLHRCASQHFFVVDFAASWFVLNARPNTDRASPAAPTATSIS